MEKIVNIRFTIFIQVQTTQVNYSFKIIHNGILLTKTMIKFDLPHMSRTMLETKAISKLY